MALDTSRHPLLAELDAMNDLLRGLILAVPQTSPESGSIEVPTPGKQKRRRPRKPGIVIVPGSGQNVEQNVETITRHNPQGQQPTNSGPNTNQFEGLPGGNSGGGGGGSW